MRPLGQVAIRFGADLLLAKLREAGELDVSRAVVDSVGEALPLADAFPTIRGVRGRLHGRIMIEHLEFIHCPMCEPSRKSAFLLELRRTTRGGS